MILEAETGDLLGNHRGFWFYTIGQRQGLRLPGGPWYDFFLSSHYCHMLVKLQQSSILNVLNFISALSHFVFTNKILEHLVASYAGMLWKKMSKIM